MPFASTSICSRLRRTRGLRGLLLPLAACCLALTPMGCGKNPTVNVTNSFTPDVGCSGHLLVTGSGFTGGGNVQISATSTQASPISQDIYTVVADTKGRIKFNLGYVYTADLAKPTASCPKASSATQSAAIGAANLSTGSLGFGTVNNMCTASVQWGLGPGLCQ